MFKKPLAKQLLLVHSTNGKEFHSPLLLPKDLAFKIKIYIKIIPLFSINQSVKYQLNIDEPIISIDNYNMSNDKKMNYLNLTFFLSFFRTLS